MRTLNKKIACTPFESTSVDVKVKGGIAQVTKKHDLIKLKVVFNSSDCALGVGDTILVRSECIKHAFASEISKYDGIEFILIPHDLIVGFEYERERGEVYIGAAPPPRCG